MNKYLKQYIGALRRESLTKAEKAEMRSFLASFMNTHPVRLPHAARLNMSKSSRAQFFEIIYKPMLASSMVALVLMLGGGSISYAAERALPGDMLYPVKIHINENLRAAVLLTAEARSGLMIDRAGRRLEEIEKLTLSGKLDSSASAKVTENFSAEVAKASKAIENFGAQGKVDAAAQASSSLEAVLQAHKKILLKAAAQSSKKSSESENILEKVEEKKSEASKARKEIEAKIFGIEKPRLALSAQKSKTAAENKIQEAKKFIEKLEEKLGEKTSAEAREKLQGANFSLERGETELRAKNYAEAFALFQESQRIAQEAKLLLKARQELDIEIINGKKDSPRGEDKKDAEEKDMLNKEGRIEGGVEIKFENGRRNSGKNFREKDESDDKSESEKEKQKDSSESSGPGRGNREKEDENNEKSEIWIEGETELRLGL